MRTSAFLTAVLPVTLGLWGAPLAAQNAPAPASLDVLTHSQPKVYEGQSVVTVTVSDLRQLRAVLALAESPWTERPGLGEVVVQIRSERIETLERLGVDPRVEIGDLQAHVDAQWESLQRIEARDRRARIGAHAPLGAGIHNDAWFGNYKQYSEILAYFDQLIAAKPGVITKQDFGDSVEGRDLWAYTITAPDQIGNPAGDRPVIIFNGTQHAREWISPMTVTYIASRLVDGASSDPTITELLERVRFVIVPVLNPDGYLYSWSNQRLWRKNRRDNPGSSEGVDLNRNWGVAFGGDGADGFTSSEVYHGPSAFSEPETAALRDLAYAFGDDLVAHIDYHSYSQLILWPLGYEAGLVTPEPDRSTFESLSIDMSTLIQLLSGQYYDPIQSWRLYPAAGTCSDWFYDDRGVTSFTVELRPNSSGLGGFGPDASLILPTGIENFAAAKLFANRTGLPISFEHTPIEIVDAGEIRDVAVEVFDGFEQLDAQGMTLWTRIGSSGAFNATPLESASGEVFEGTLPAATCGDRVEYYFTAQTSSGTTVSFPSAGANAPFAALAQEIDVLLTDDMETDLGWTVGAPGDTATTGVWERGDPQGTESQPEDDHTPGGTDCWVTGAPSGGSNGANDIDGGATTLTSPRLDASGSGDAELVYWRWYSNDRGASPNADAMLVEISGDDGATWTTLETVTENEYVWTQARFRVSDYVTPSDTLRVRFVASDLAEGSLVEAAVDDLRIEAVGCPGNPADLTGDGVLDFADASAFLTLFAQGDLSVDFDNSGALDFADVSAFLAAFSAAP